MGTTDSLIVYDYMNALAQQHAATYFAQSNIFYTDVQAEGVQLPDEYAVIRQFNTSLDPKGVGGNRRKQNATLIVEYNVKKFNDMRGREMQLDLTYHTSAMSHEHDIVIDSLTTNEYNNPRGTKFVTVIDFNYFLRV